MGNRVIFRGIFNHSWTLFWWNAVNRDCILLLTLLTKTGIKILHFNKHDALWWIASQLKSNDKNLIRINVLCVYIGLRGSYYDCLRLFSDIVLFCFSFLRYEDEGNIVGDQRCFGSSSDCTLWFCCDFMKNCMYTFFTKSDN